MQELLEQLALRLNYVAEAVLTESTLTKLVGTDVAGLNLARYVHSQFRVADSAVWVRNPDAEVNLSAVKDSMAIRKTPQGVRAVTPARASSYNADNLVLYRGPRGWCFVKRTEEQRYGSGQMWEYYLSLSPIPTDVEAEKAELEKTRDLKFGVKRADSRTGVEKVRGNRIYDLPHIERGIRIVKKRTTKPKEMLADIKLQLEGITDAWTATEREERDEDLGKKQYAWYRDQLTRSGFDPDNIKYWSMTSDERKKFDAIQRSFPKLHSGQRLSDKNSPASIESDKIASRRGGISYFSPALSSRLSDIEGSEKLATSSVDVYKIAFNRVLVRLDRIGNDGYIKQAENQFDRDFGEDDSIALQVWRRDYTDKILAALSKSKTAKGQQQYKELIDHPSGTTAKRILLDYAIKKLMKEFTES